MCRVILTGSRTRDIRKSLQTITYLINQKQARLMQNLSLPVLMKACSIKYKTTILCQNPHMHPWPMMTKGQPTKRVYISAGNNSVIGIHITGHQ